MANIDIDKLQGLLRSYLKLLPLPKDIRSLGKDEDDPTLLKMKIENIVSHVSYIRGSIFGVLEIIKKTKNGDNKTTPQPGQDS